MNSVAINDSVKYVGVFDPDIRTFDIIMKTANGTSYNSYVVRGSEGVAVMDTVKLEFQDEFFKNLESVCSYDEIKYIVLHHLEPDHSGALPELMARAPQAKLIISFRAVMMLKALIKEDIEYETVGNGQTLSLGDKTIEFLQTPFLHWPDTMSSYLKEEKTLFSGDVFGCHFYDERLFDDKVGDFDYAYRYYYDHIMRPFKSHVLNAIKLYDKLDIKLIAPLHGPIHRENPRKYIDLYREWSSDSRFSKSQYGDKRVSIFYMSSYNNTKEMAKALYSGLESVDGVRASLYDLSSLDENNMIDLLEESDGVLLGSPTINGDAVKPAWDLLSCIAFIQNIGKVGGTFGSYGWTGEAPDMLNYRMKTLKFRVPQSPLKIKLIPTKDELLECEKYGIEFGEILNGKIIELTLD